MAFNLAEYMATMQADASATLGKVGQQQRAKRHDPTKSVGVTVTFVSHIKGSDKNKETSSAPFILALVPGKQYYPNAKIEGIFRSAGLVDEKTRIDPQTGELLALCKVSAIDENATFLTKNAALIHSPEKDNDPYIKAMRDFVTKEGIIMSKMWVPMRVGERVTVRFPYDTDSTLYKKKPGMSNTYLLQPGLDIFCPDTQFEVYLMIKNEQIDDPTHTEALKEGEERRKINIQRLVVAKSLKCNEKNPEIVMGQQTDLCQSEMANERIPLGGTHPFVRVDDVLAGKAELPPSVNMRVSSFFLTPFLLADTEDNYKGLTVIRSRQQPLKDFYVKVKQTEKEYGLVTIQGEVAQWTGRPDPKKDQKFPFLFKSDSKSGTDLWRRYGFIDETLYALAMVQNPEIPVLFEGNIWPAYTLGKNISQDAKKIDADLQSVAGLYQGDIRMFVVDHLRGFRGGAGYGYRVTETWVRDDFSLYWQKARDEDDETKMRDVLVLKPNAPPEYKNPYDGDLEAVVVPLGQGDCKRRALRPASERTEVARDSLIVTKSTDASSLFAGKHDFFVVPVFFPDANFSDPERQKYTTDPELIADEHLDEIIRNYGNKMRYFVFAVQKDVKMGPSWHTLQAEKKYFSAPVEDKSNNNKREERDEREEEDGGNNKRIKVEVDEVAADDDDDGGVSPMVVDDQE